MTLKSTLNSNLFIFGIPLLLLLSSIFLANQIETISAERNSFSAAITLDFVITIPLIYLLLIRKTSISKFTVMPFFVAGIVIASFVIPTSNQTTLDLLKTWLLPLVEITVVTLIFLKFRKFRKYFLANKNGALENDYQRLDFVSTLKKSATELLPPKVANALSTEIGLFYYSFITWKKQVYTKTEFTYHKESGIQGILGIILGVALIELFCVHLLIHESYPIFSWILSILSAYGVIQIFGLMKSIPRTPAYFTQDTLVIRMGIFQETIIPLKKIESVELTMADYPKKDKSYQRITFFDHNCIIHLKETETLTSLFGIKKNYEHLILSIDEKQRFKETIMEKKKVFNEI